MKLLPGDPSTMVDFADFKGSASQLKQRFEYLTGVLKFDTETSAVSNFYLFCDEKRWLYRLVVLILLS